MSELKYNQEFVIKALSLYRDGNTPSEIWEKMGKPAAKMTFVGQLYKWARKVNLTARLTLDWSEIEKQVNPQKEDYP